MNRATREAVLSYAAPHSPAAGIVVYPATTPFPSDLGVAVYAAFDAAGACRYVGSVARGTNALRSRIGQHLADRVKSATWRSVAVLELWPKTPVAVVRSIEGMVGLHLGPVDSRRLPVVRLHAASARRVGM